MIRGWIGELGRLQPVWSTPSMSITPTVERTYTDTLGGRRFVRQAPRGHREWAMAGDHGFGDELAPVSMFASGAWGVGPWWWLSPWAVGANMLPPEGSLLEYAHMQPGGSVSGPVQADDGQWFPTSAVVSGASTIGVARTETAMQVPCPAGVPVTAGIFASPGQQVRLMFSNIDYVSVGSALSPSVTGTGMRRVTASRVAPAGTASVRVDVVGAGRLAGASLTMTPAPAPWALGDGCERAVVDAESRDVAVIAARPTSSQKFTIREVG